MLSIAFLSAGDRVFTTSYAITRIWDPETGEELHTLHGHKGSVNSAGFSPDGDRIITASTDATARFWDAATGEELRVLGGHKSDVTCAAFLPAGDRIVTASADHTARIWDAATGDELACWTLDTSITALAVHGPMLVLGDRLGGVHSYKSIVAQGSLECAMSEDAVNPFALYKLYLETAEKAPPSGDGRSG